MEKSKVDKILVKDENESYREYIYVGVGTMKD